jgi:hypothetical protein
MNDTPPMEPSIHIQEWPPGSSQFFFNIVGPLGTALHASTCYYTHKDDAIKAAERWLANEGTDDEEG